MLMPKRKLNPLPSAAFQILLSLADEDLHGYGIMRQVAEQTGGRMRLGPGTLYSSIHALLEGALIKEVDLREHEKLGHERRRYYHLTSLGRKLARSEADRLAGLLRVARDNLGGALEDATFALEVARRADEPQALLPTLTTKAYVLEARGEHDEARRLMSEVTERLQPLKDGGLPFRGSGAACSSTVMGQPC